MSLNDFFENELSEIISEFAGSLTHGEEWDLVERAEILRRDIREAIVRRRRDLKRHAESVATDENLIASVSRQIERARERGEEISDGLLHDAALYPEWLAVSTARVEATEKTIAEHVALRDELTDGLRAFASLERWRSKRAAENVALLEEWRAGNR